MTIKFDFDHVDDWRDEALSEFIIRTLDAIVTFNEREKCCIDKRNKVLLRSQFCQLLSDFVDKEMPF